MITFEARGDSPKTQKKERTVISRLRKPLCQHAKLVAQNVLVTAKDGDISRRRAGRKDAWV
jgi:hypothetical protein